MRRTLCEVRVAFAFLTCLPIGPRQELADTIMGRSMAWFVGVGLALGAGLYGLDCAMASRLPPALCNGLLVLFMILMTGALHMDGLADFCDGLGAGADSDRALRIMQDSRVGSFGALGACMGILLKVFALMALLPPARGAALILFPAVGRWVAVLLSWALPYARHEGGTGGAFVLHVGPREVLWASLWMVSATLLLFPRRGLWILGVTVLGTWGVGVFCKRRFGGVTGDILGAAIEGAEICTIILLAIKI